jgi:hypothetical protein
MKMIVYVNIEGVPVPVDQSDPHKTIAYYKGRAIYLVHCKSGYGYMTYLDGKNVGESYAFLNATDALQDAVSNIVMDIEDQKGLLK